MKQKIKKGVDNFYTVINIILGGLAMFLFLLKIINLLVIVSILGLIIKSIEVHQKLIMGLVVVALILSILSFLF